MSGGTLSFPVPDYLTQPRERDLYRRVTEELGPRRLARLTDINEIARYASYLTRWVDDKLALDGKQTWWVSESKHGKLLRRHPIFKDMLDLERVLQSLEDRLGLNPLARQNLIRGLAAMPRPLDLFDDTLEEPDGRSGEALPEQPEDPLPQSPVGFLAHVASSSGGKPN